MSIWPEIRCPSCLADDSIELASGGRLCLSCRYEWKPADHHGPLTDDATIGAEIERRAELVNTDDATAADLAAQLAAARATFVGHDVIVHELEHAGRVVDVLDNGYAVIEFGSGYQVACTPDEFSLIPSAEPTDNEIVELGAVDLSAAALVIRAAIGAFVEDDAGRRIGLAPNGWLPQDVDAWPVVEHGASYAVAILADVYGITTEQLSEIATKIDNAAQAAGEATTP